MNFKTEISLMYGKSNFLPMSFVGTCLHNWRLMKFYAVILNGSCFCLTSHTRTREEPKKNKYNSTQRLVRPISLGLPVPSCLSNSSQRPSYITFYALSRICYTYVRHKYERRVRLSVCLPHAGIDSKPMNIGYAIFIIQWIEFKFWHQLLQHSSRENTPCEAFINRRPGKTAGKRRFSPTMSLYLGDDRM